MDHSGQPYEGLMGPDVWMCSERSSHRPSSDPTERKSVLGKAPRRSQSLPPGWQHRLHPLLKGPGSRVDQRKAAQRLPEKAARAGDATSGSSTGGARPSSAGPRPPATAGVASCCEASRPSVSSRRGEFVR
jgi:hypothetical protein